MDSLEQLPAGIPVARACAALGASRATLYRHTSVPVPPRPRTKAPPRALSSQDRAEVVNALHSSEFSDQPPREVYATLLSMGVYLASVRTMYRILEQLGENAERRRGHNRTPIVLPQLEATAPNQVWTWDIVRHEAPLEPRRDERTRPLTRRSGSVEAEGSLIPETRERAGSSPDKAVAFNAAQSLIPLAGQSRSDPRAVALSGCRWAGDRSVSVLRNDSEGRS
jgi:transposase InsO family protein